MNDYNPSAKLITFIWICLQNSGANERIKIAPRNLFYEGLLINMRELRQQVLSKSIFVRSFAEGESFRHQALYKSKVVTALWLPNPVQTLPYTTDNKFHVFQ